MNDRASEELVRLGLTEYQSKVYSALAAIGPSGVTEINRFSGVPRTKVYETLQELISKGCVEFHPGRPAIYRPVRPMILIRSLTKDYLSTAQRAERLLEHQYESVHDVEQNELIWTVRGDVTISRKLAELIASARKSVLLLETYPPRYIPSVKSILKAASNRGTEVRVMCVIVERQSTFDFPEPELIHYKSLALSSSGGYSRGKVKPTERELADPFLKPLSLTFSSPYGVALIDGIEAFVMMQNPTDQSRSMGFSARIPGVPQILSVMFDRLFKFGRPFNVKI